MDDEGAQVTGYDLFVKIAKNLALKLPLERDRVLAAKWIRKIDNLMDLDFPQKTKYLKLLNISMQSKVLVGPFRNPPQLDDFDVQDLYNLKPVDLKDMITDEHKMNIFRPHPYYAEVSNDLKEYVVVQEIPEFGTHFYYACSVEPITSWQNNNFAIIPKGVIEASVIKPPLPQISESKEEFVKNYNLYAQNFNKGGKNSNGPECSENEQMEPKNSGSASKNCRPSHSKCRKQKSTC